MLHADGLTDDNRSPRRRVLARIESEPIPYGTWSALFDTIAEAAALDMGVMLGGHVIDCADDGWEPAEGAEPESWRPTVEIERLRAELADAVELRDGFESWWKDICTQFVRVVGLFGPVPSHEDFANMADRVMSEIAVLRTRIDELEAALAHRGVEMAYTHNPYVVPWEQLSEATRERLRAKCREIEADYLARGYVHVDSEHGSGLQAPPFEDWFRELLAVIFVRETRPIPITRDSVDAAAQEVAALGADNAALRRAIRGAINMLGPEPCTCPVSEDCAHGCGGSRAEVAEALRILREGLGETRS